MHLVITDSGLGGLLICAGIERALRAALAQRDVRLTYVNAWPDERHGYNDLPDMRARAATFDRALAQIQGMQPDAIVIACNTLSIVYGHTRFCHDASVPVAGIVEAGVDLFERALRERPGSSIVLVGTRTTIESQVHRRRLVEKGLSPIRIAAAACHGLAAAIEEGPESDATDSHIERCALSASEAAAPGVPLYVGLCCTHYGMVAERIRDTAARASGRTVVTLDPNEGLVAHVVALIGRIGSRDAGTGNVAVEVISKVELKDEKREAVARVVERASPPTGDALRAYRHVPTLFSFFFLVLSFSSFSRCL